MSLIFSAGEKLLPAHLNALANCKGMNLLPGLTTTTTSSSFANTPATSSVIFTKFDAASNFRIDFHATCYATGSVPTAVEFAVQINGTDYVIGRNSFATASVHKQFSGIQLIGGITAGTYTIQARWRRTSGTGTVTIDANDRISFAVTETQA